MFAGINFKEFLSEYQEWHALVEGICEGFTLGRIKLRLTGDLLKALRKEHHYYVAGCVLGFIGLVVFGVLVYKAVT